MKLLLLGLAALIICGLISPTRGDLLQLRKMIKKMTGKPITHYISYGCFCGWGGKGQPLDASDGCCQVHDCCYEKLKEKKCLAKLSSYKYSIRNGQIHCGGNKWCERKSCECDKEIALCLRKEMNTYHSKYRWIRWYKRNWCKKPTTPCSSVKS
uniref:Phospholipase A2 n=1 Tax=Phascolarctos cinereus TaxID=38626 RepID=A0A6P5J3F1_PHACI|nr:basic phospholipase A2 RVV-VD-like [Phascolarctos cinereus]